MATSGGTVIGYTVAHRYKVLGLLGRGAFGAVFRVKDVKAGNAETIKALKEIYMGSTAVDLNTQTGTVTEAKLQCNLDHSNIVKFYDSFYEGTNFYICTEYCEGGDLNKVIEEHKKTKTLIPENQIWLWLVQIVLGVQYIHMKKILHRDIKTRNIFLRNNIIKIGDFGISRILGNTHLAQTRIGTPFYMSPEVVKCEGYNNKADIWSVGCVLYELVALRPAYEGRDIFQVVDKIKKDDIPKWPDASYSGELKEVFEITMQKDPTSRPSAGQLQRLKSMQKHAEDVEEEMTKWLTKAQSAIQPDPKSSTVGSEESLSLDKPTDKKSESLKKFWEQQKSKGDHGILSKDPPKPSVKIKVTVFEAVVDNATTTDVENILQQIKNVMEGDGSSTSGTLKYNSDEDPFSTRARTHKIEEYKTEARLILGESYDEAYGYMKSARSPTSTITEDDITSKLQTYGDIMDLQAILDQIIFLEQQLKKVERRHSTVKK